jgi:hypothetical protein
MIRFSSLIWILLIGLFLVCCAEKPCATHGLMINDFETDDDLDRLNWKCYTLFSLSDKGVSHGRSSLKMTMTPSPYPGISFIDIPKDWRCFSGLAVSFFNPGAEDVRLALRIDDREEAPEYEDRVNSGFVLKPGMNRIRIPFESLMCPSGRRLDLSHIFSVMFFCVNPDSVVVLYVDEVRLVL